MQDFWEGISKGADELPAMQAALQAKGTSLADAFHAYAIGARFERACGGGYAYPYCFEEGPAMVAEAGPPGPVAQISAVGGKWSGQVQDDYALAWIDLPSASSPYDVTLTNTSAGGSLRTTLVCDTGATLRRTPLPAVVGSGQSATATGFDPRGCLTTTAVITNEAQTAPNPASSAARGFTLRTAASAGTPGGAPPETGGTPPPTEAPPPTGPPAPEPGGGSPTGSGPAPDPAGGSAPAPPPQAAPEPAAAEAPFSPVSLLLRRPAPSISHVSLSSRAFAHHAWLRYRVSDTTDVRISVVRWSHRARRYRRLAAWTIRARQGASRVRIGRRLRGRRLVPGKYRVLVGLSELRSPIQSIAFRITVPRARAGR
jgi:hypothetical protein